LFQPKAAENTAEIIFFIFFLVFYACQSNYCKLIFLSHAAQNSAACLTFYLAIKFKILVMKNSFDGNHLPINEVKRTDGKSKWLRSKGAKQLLGDISDSTLQTMRIRGDIPAYKLGSTWFYKEDEILAALEAGRTSRQEVNNG